MLLYRSVQNRGAVAIQQLPRQFAAALSEPASSSNSYVVLPASLDDDVPSYTRVPLGGSLSEDQPSTSSSSLSPLLSVAKAWTRLPDVYHGASLLQGPSAVPPWYALQRAGYMSNAGAAALKQDFEYDQEKNFKPQYRQQFRVAPIGVREAKQVQLAVQEKKSEEPGLEGDKPAQQARPRGLPEWAKKGAQVSAEEVAAFRQEHEIEVHGAGADAVPPFISFAVANFPPALSKEFERAGYSEPSPIQAESWPVALAGRDVVAVAKTGSGKTLGYLLPALAHIAAVRRMEKSQSSPTRQKYQAPGPIALVLAPTRELAVQIKAEADRWGYVGGGTRAVCCYGGASRMQQLRDLWRGPEIVIATPGRMNDFLESGDVSLSRATFLALDEADRMLDMGFEPQIKSIMKDLPTDRQTVFYTATWPREVESIAAELLQDPVQIRIGDSNELVANKAITQIVEMVPHRVKFLRLAELLEEQQSQSPGSKTMVFCSTKRMCDELELRLGNDLGAAAIHGDKSQSARDYVLAKFRRGQTRVLIATDVAARGLDIKDVNLVINYDFPADVEDYVHRIGRTGRAGNTGTAVTFFNVEKDVKHAGPLVKVMELSGQAPPPELLKLARAQGRGNADRQSRYRSGPFAQSRGGSSFGRGSFGRPKGSGFGDRHGFGERNGYGDRHSSGDKYGQRGQRVHKERPRSPKNGFDDFLA